MDDKKQTSALPQKNQKPDADDKHTPQEETFNEGPLAMLTKAVKSNS